MMPIKLSRYTHVLPLSKGAGLLYNGASGAIVEMSTDGFAGSGQVARAHRSREAAMRRHALFNDLIAGQFVVRQDVDELQLIKDRYEKERRKSQFCHDLAKHSRATSMRYACRQEIEWHVTGSAGRHSRVRGAEGWQSAPRAEMHVDWFGGVALLSLDVIERLSAANSDTLQETRVKYRAQGDFERHRHHGTETVEVLERASVDSIQICSDGPAAIHDSRRPYKSGTKSSFDTITPDT
jgi:hypothetical protein